MTFCDLPGALGWCEIEHQTLTALPGWSLAYGAGRAAGQIAYLLTAEGAGRTTRPGTVGPLSGGWRQRSS